MRATKGQNCRAAQCVLAAGASFVSSLTPAQRPFAKRSGGNNPHVSFLFRIGAPIFKLAGRRWSADDFAVLGSRLRPFVPPDGVILDLGGGTGDLAKGLAQNLGCRVVIVDPTPQMLKRAPSHPLLTAVRGAAEDIRFPDGYFDALLCSDAFHHFRDWELAAKEMARVVRPGGAVLVLEFDPRRVGRVLELFERAFGEPGKFPEPEVLTKLLAKNGVIGDTADERGPSYSYLGVVGPS
jgi:ubiquinone/menaquinone biosynthesis C-methylase UbiE